MIVASRKSLELWYFIFYVVRMVGCCCEDDYQDIVWFELNKGEVQQCDCGNYFKLIDYDPLDPNIKPKYGMGFGSGLGSIYY